MLDKLQQIKKYYIPCKMCGVTQERCTTRLDITCFDCKRTRMNESDKKRRSKL